MNTLKNQKGPILGEKFMLRIDSTKDLNSLRREMDAIRRISVQPNKPFVEFEMKLKKDYIQHCIHELTKSDRRRFAIF